MSVTRWTITDGTTTATFLINPSAQGSPWPVRQLTGMRTTAGTLIVTEGSLPAAEMSFSGVILSKAHYDMFVEWFYGASGMQRVTITDHFGRQIVCVPKSFNPKSKRALKHYWAHDFDASVLVVSVGAATIGDVW